MLGGSFHGQTHSLLANGRIPFYSGDGNLLHFLFDLTGGSVVAALVSAVNESIWEHLKLLFYPMITFALAEYFFWGKNRECFWQIKGLGILLGLVLIPVVYYTTNGIFGKSADWLNIALFFLVAAASFWTETKLFERNGKCTGKGILPAIVILGVAILFTVFTFAPPRIPLFLDPMTGTYGFQG